MFFSFTFYGPLCIIKTTADTQKTIGRFQHHTQLKFLQIFILSDLNDVKLLSTEIGQID